MSLNIDVECRWENQNDNWEWIMSPIAINKHNIINIIQEEWEFENDITEAFDLEDDKD